MRNRALLTLLLSIPLLAACFITPHKMDVQQGNYLDQDTVAKLKPDMTRSQVRFLLGTPLLADPFHPDRWDYLYLVSKSGKLKTAKRLTLTFEGDTLKSAVTDVPVPGAKVGSERTAATSR